MNIPYATTFLNKAAFQRSSNLANAADETNDHNHAFVAGRWYIAIVEYAVNDQMIYTVEIYENLDNDFYSQNFDHFESDEDRMVLLYETNQPKEVTKRFYDEINRRTELSTD